MFYLISYVNLSTDKTEIEFSLFFLGMEQFEQLLTCAICLDRYRNPKLLPCQHSFCMEPCMDGLVDYVRRQVKCPECRAEHRIPYQVNYTFSLLKYILGIQNIYLVYKSLELLEIFFKLLQKKLCTLYASDLD